MRILLEQRESRILFPFKVYVNNVSLMLMSVTLVDTLSLVYLVRYLSLLTSLLKVFLIFQPLLY